VLIRRPELEGIRSGTVSLAFRRWPRPRVLPGTRLRTGMGVVAVLAVDEIGLDEITEADAVAAGQASRSAVTDYLERRAGTVYRISLRYEGPDPRVALRERADLSPAERDELLARLEAMDPAAGRDGWPAAYLALIEGSPNVHAATLAEGLGLETQAFKRRVRRLKELGLTESLRPGYRLSPRGRAVLAAMRSR
jgi:hypothetical protein